MNTDPLVSFLKEAGSTALKTGAEIAIARNTPQKAAVNGTTPIPQSPVPAAEVDPLAVETKERTAKMMKVMPYLIYGGIIIVGGIVIYRLVKK